MKSLPIPLVVVLGLASVLRAQPTPGVPQTVSVDFAVVGWGKPVEGICYRQNGALRVITADEVVRSEVYRYTGPQTMELYRLPRSEASGTTPAALSTTPLPIAGKVIFDPAVRRATVLLVPQAGKYEGVVIAEDDDKFPVGHALLINCSTVRLGIRCNTRDTIVLAPQERKLVARNSRGELDAAIAAEQQGSWRRLARKFVPVLADQQTIIAFVKDPDGGDSVEVFVIRQSPPAKELKIARRS